MVRRFSAKVKIIVFYLVRCFRADVEVIVQLGARNRSPLLTRAACVHFDPSPASETPAMQGKAKPEFEEQDLFPARLHSVTNLS